jgi:hypothetical protein
MSAAAARRNSLGLAISYRARSRRNREVLIAVDDLGEWAVYDTPAGGTGKTGRLVDRLAGHDERLLQALALQAEYAADQQAYSAGRREEHLTPDPLPSARRVAMTQIRRDAERALRLACALAVTAEDRQLLDQWLPALTGEATPSAGALAAAA